MEFAGAFLHAGESDAQGMIFGQALAVIGDLHDDGVIRGFQRDGDAAGSGVFVHVGEAFLDNAEDGGLEILREARQVARNLEVRGDFAALREALDVNRQGRLETGLIEQRRMQQMRERADLL